MDERNTLADAEMQHYVDNFQAMYATEGWAQLIKDAGEILKGCENIATIADEKTLMFRKGQRDILLWLTQHKDIVERQHAAALKEEELAERARQLGVDIEELL